MNKTTHIFPRVRKETRNKCSELNPSLECLSTRYVDMNVVCKEFETKKTVAVRKDESFIISNDLCFHIILSIKNLLETQCPAHYQFFIFEKGC